MTAPLRLRFTPVLLLLAGLSAAASVPPAPREALLRFGQDTRLWIGGPAPKASETSRPILMYFWNAGCGECTSASQRVGAVGRRWKDSLATIVVHTPKFPGEQNPETVRHEAERMGLPLPLFQDASGKWFRRFGVTRWPTAVLWDPAGRVAGVFTGSAQFASLDHSVATVVRKSGGAETPAGEREPREAPLAPRPLHFPEKLVLGPVREGEQWVFVADTGNHRVLAVSLTPPHEGVIRWEAGQRGRPGWQDGPAATARFSAPRGLLFVKDRLYVADTDNHRIREIDLTRDVVRTVAGTGLPGTPRVPRGEKALSVALNAPRDLALMPDGRHIAVAQAGIHQIWQWDWARGTMHHLAGSGELGMRDGTFPAQSLAEPSALAVKGGELYFLDAQASALRAFATGQVRTVVGRGLFQHGEVDGLAAEARLQLPLGLATGTGGLLWIADTYNDAIRVWDGRKLTTPGADGEKVLNRPRGVMPWKEKVLVADTNQHRLLWWDPRTRRWVRLFVRPPYAPRPLPAREDSAT